MAFISLSLSGTMAQGAFPTSISLISIRPPVHLDSLLGLPITYEPGLKPHPEFLHALLVLLLPVASGKGGRLLVERGNAEVHPHLRRLPLGPFVYHSLGRAHPFAAEICFSYERIIEKAGCRYPSREHRLRKPRLEDRLAEVVRKPLPPR